MMRWIVLISLAFIIFAGCVASLPQGPPVTATPAVPSPTATAQLPPPLITGTAWQLISYVNTDDTPVPPLTGTAVTAFFGENGQLSGSSGCNRYTASYQLESPALTIGPAVATKMYCSNPPGSMVQETRFLSLLPYARSVSLSDGRLNIRDAGGNTVLVFSPMVSQSSLTGSWHLSSYASGSSSLIPVTSGTSITATFGNDGRLSGSAGCNQYSSTYTTSRSSFTVGQVATTLLFCDEPAGIMEQENRFLALLPSVTHYQVSGRQLILTDAADEKALVFTRQ